MTTNFNQYYRVASAVPYVRVADVDYNILQIKHLCEQANNQKVNLIVFPELSITGYTSGDLFGQSLLLDKAIHGLETVRNWSKKWPNMIIVVGAPITNNIRTYNCAVFIQNGTYLGIIPKTYLPNYKEFYEKRWFASSSDLNECVSINIAQQQVRIDSNLLFRHGAAIISAEICEDLWAPIPPSSKATLNGANIIVNLSATNELTGKHDYLLSLIKQQSARSLAAYIYSSAGPGESSTDLVYSGNAVIAENGKILTQSPRFQTIELLEVADIDIESLSNDRRNVPTYSDCSTHHSAFYETISCKNYTIALDRVTSLQRKVNPLPFVPISEIEKNERCNEIISIQTEGLMQRLRATGCKNLVVGISGGLDSTLAILIAGNAFDRLSIDRVGIHGITMPGFGTTDRTYDNAVNLIRFLGASFDEISISKSVRQHFSDIGHNESVQDVTYENSQARERTQILMDYANKVNGMVLGTGDLSELALGWCTYNGDQMSMYGVNSSIPKTLVRHLVQYYAESVDNPQLRNTLIDIVNTPISPELIPADNDGNIIQKTEDLVGPYPLHDFFLYNTLRHGFSPAKILLLAQNAFKKEYTEEVILHWLKVFYRRFFTQQFKRSCMPDGPKVGSVSLSPRGDWRMPSDASVAAWINECEKM